MRVEIDPWFDALGFKVDPQHSAACFLAEQGRDEFIVHERMDFHRDRIGRRRSSGGQAWHVFKCNDPNCDARLNVRWDQLMHFGADGLRAADSQPHPTKP